MKDLSKINFKKMIEEDIILDISKFPNSVIEKIKELEKLNEIEDWFLYDLKYEALETDAKGYMISGIISESDFYKIQRKYGGYID